MASPEPKIFILIHDVFAASAFLFGPIIGMVLGAKFFWTAFRRWLPDPPSSAWNDKERD